MARNTASDPPDQSPLPLEPIPGPTPKQRRARAALERIDRLGRLLDASIRVPGTDFKTGLDPLIGLIPGLGDVLGGLLSGYLILEAWRAEVPRPQLGRMVKNVALETLVGLVPVLGDVFDFAYKANVRNARIARAAIERRHFPEVPPEPTLWQQPRALLVVAAGAALVLLGLGYAAGSCGAAG